MLRNTLPKLLFLLQLLCQRYRRRAVYENHRVIQLRRDIRRPVRLRQKLHQKGISLAEASHRHRRVQQRVRLAALAHSGKVQIIASAKALRLRRQRVGGAEAVVPAAGPVAAVDVAARFEEVRSYDEISVAEALFQVRAHRRIVRRFRRDVPVVAGYHLTDAKWLATVADSVAPDADNTCKLAVMQCIINWTKYSGFPNSIESVCSQKNQWQGYTATSTYSDSTYKLARELVDSIGEFRITPIETNMVYVRVGESGLYFRASWNETNEQYIPYYS